MNCQRFEQRFNELLDQRSDVASDKQLLKHTAHCNHCQATMETWMCIERGLEGCQNACTPSASTATESHAAMWSSALAASILLIVVGSKLVSSPSIPQEPSAAEASELSAAPTNIEEPTAVATPTDANRQHQLAWAQRQWWSAVQEEQWVRRTIPAMDSMRESIAPIGRSMRQAIAILMNTPMVPSLETMSPESPSIDSPLSDTPIQEQTQHSQFLAQGEKMV